MQIGVQREFRRVAVRTLTATAEVPTQSYPQMTVEAIEHAMGVTMTKIVSPSPN